MTEITFNASILRYCIPAISKEEARYYLNGIHIEWSEHGVIAVSTDGHILLAARDPEAEIPTSGNRIIAQGAEFFRVLKLRKTETVTLDIADGQHDDIVWTMRDVSGERTGKGFLNTIDHTFPDWRTAFPKTYEAKANPSFDPALLKRLHAAWKPISMCSAMRLISSDLSSPTLIKFADRNFTGLIMPMRGEETDRFRAETWVIDPDLGRVTG